MAIQNRRGAYGNYDPTKLLPGEFAIVQSDDPDGNNGYAVYIALAAGVVIRLISSDDLTNALSELSYDWSEMTGNLAEDYSSSATYAEGAYCIYNNQLYRCTSAITTAEAFNTAHWTAVNTGSELVRVMNAIATKQDALTFDTTPRSGSTNPVTSGGIYSYVDTKIYNYSAQQQIKDGYIVGNFAGSFTTGKSYAVGDLAIRNWILYRFTTAHTGTWSDSDVEQVTVEEVIQDVLDSFTAVTLTDGVLYI